MSARRVSAGLRARDIRTGLLLILLATFVSASLASAQDLPEVPAPPTPSDAAAELAAPPVERVPEFNGERWYKVLGANFVGAEMTSVTVDPANPQRLFVGTEQGLVLRSEDGGITWDELEVRPNNIRTHRDLGPPRLQFSFGEDSRLVHIIREPYRPSTLYIALFEGLPLAAPNANMRADDPAANLLLTLVLPATDDVVPTQLADSLISQPTEAIERMAVCRGARYPLLASSRLELFGSDDDGITWVPLLRLPSTGRIAQIACHPTRPNDIFVTTDQGIFFSRDGGQTIDLDTSGFPPGRAEAIHIDDDGRVLVSIGDMLFAGTPEDGFEYIYPRFEDSQTAPWSDITWVTRSDDEIWIATKDGLRVSRDDAASWENVAPTRYSRHFMSQVVVAPTENGDKRIVALARVCPPHVHGSLQTGCSVTDVLSSTDGGESWEPFFMGITAHSTQFMTYVPAGPNEPTGRWLVVTSGELWASRTLGETVFAPETRAWAQERREAMPPLDTILNRSLENIGLDPDSYQRVLDRSSRQGWVPRVQFLFQWSKPLGNLDASILPFPRFTAGLDGRVNWAMQMFLQWDLPTAVRSYNELDYSRGQLIQQRARISYLVEDAWHERESILQRLERGTETLLQAEMLKARIETLDTILDFYLGDLFAEER